LRFFARFAGFDLAATLALFTGFAVATPSGTEHRQFLYPGNRETIRWQASQAALDMVRRELIKM